MSGVGVGLLPCPCCGGDAASNTCRTSEKEYIRLNGRDTGYGVNCILCGLNNRGIAIGYKTPELAAAAWNTRQALAAQEWMPIESAPKGVSVLIACRGDKGWAVGEAMLHTNGEWWWTNNDPTDSWGTNVYPDFYQPLPAPPAKDLQP